MTKESRFLAVLAASGLTIACVTSAAAQVQTLATNQGAPGNLAVDGARVYWIDRQSGAVSSVDKANGGLVMMHSGGNAAPGYELRQDDAFLYFSADGNFPQGGGPTAIYKVAKTSASVAQLSSNDIVPSFALNAGSLHYIGRFRQPPGTFDSSDPLVSLSTQGGNETILLWNSIHTTATPNYPLSANSFATDGNYVYWANAANGASGILHLPLGGGAVATDVSTTNNISSIAVPSTGATSGYIFWADATTGELMMKPPGGTAVPILNNAQPVDQFVHCFAVIGADVYAGQQGAIVSVHIDGSSASAPSIVVPAPNAFPIAMTSDCSVDGVCHLYWSDLLNAGIERVAINANGMNGGGGGPTPTPTPSISPSATPTPPPRSRYMRFVGPIGWSTPNGTTGTLTANEISFTQAGATSGSIRLELWAFATPFSEGVPPTGYRVATYSLPALQGGSNYTNVNSGSIPFTAPPNGWWHMVVLLTEYTGQSSADDGYTFDDWVDFANPYVVGGSAAPTPTPAQLANISTRGFIQSGDSVMIGGFIVTGSASKKIIVRGIGPSLPIAGALSDPTIELHDANRAIATNDNWIDSQQIEIAATGVAPTNNLEPAVIATLPGNNAAYTAILSGKNGATGIGLVEVYDLSASPGSALANISTRGFVDTGDNVMIGGFITTPSSGAAKILVRGIGPSLTAAGVSGALADPMLELHDANGAIVASNDDWKETQQAEVEATGIPPGDDAESAMVQTLWAGNYTAILRGKNNTGVGLVEIYRLK